MHLASGSSKALTLSGHSGSEAVGSQVRGQPGSSAGLAAPVPRCGGAALRVRRERKENHSHCSGGREEAQPLSGFPSFHDLRRRRRLHRASFNLELQPARCPP